MSNRTPDDIIRSDECNTYVMSCHLSSPDLYKAMREDIRTLCKEYSTLKARLDEIIRVLEVSTIAVEKHDFLSCTLIHETQEARAVLTASEVKP